MKFPWKLLITATLICIILKPIFPDDTEYLMASAVAGGVLFVIDFIFKLGLNK